MRSSISSWLSDDPEFLRATLELIDTWSETSNLDLVTSSASRSSSDGHESTTSSEPEEFVGAEHEELFDNDVDGLTLERTRTKLHALSKTATAPRGTKTNLSTNQRRRQEIRVLQVQIRAMEAQVAALQTGRERLSVGHSPQKLLLLWQQIAENQRRLRNKSELERVKLRKLLQAHASIAKGMTQLMQKAHVLKDAAVMQSLSKEQTVASRLHDDQCLDQFQRVELMYSQMDVVFAHGHFRDGSSSFVDAEIVNDLERKVVLEFRETFTVPFEPLEVLDALWSFTKKRYETKWKSPGQQVLVDTADSFLTQFSTRGAIDESLFSFAGQLLLRRFDQKTAEPTPAIVTSMMSAPNKNGGSLQIWMDEHACSRLATLGGRSPLTRVQSYHHVSVQFDENDDVTSRLHATTLLNFVLGKLQSDIQVKQNFIETFLLQL